MGIRASKTRAKPDMAPAVPEISKKGVYSLHWRGPGRFAVVAYNSRLAGKLNLLLGRYGPGVSFANSETLFCFTSSEVPRVAAVLRLKGLPDWLR